MFKGRQKKSVEYMAIKRVDKVHPPLLSLSLSLSLSLQAAGMIYVRRTARLTHRPTPQALMDRVVNEVQMMHRLQSPHTLRFHNW